ncbi:hypothetical protein NESM_000158900 [Novymonas esmeraldas]|uniref:Uncharacterized protein n=1 Tax=Novymonas esmeraldas TaxID=1808958 RepID=A0AAW0F383_9TRYP
MSALGNGESPRDRSDMFVTSLDVFTRRTYFDPYTNRTDTAAALAAAPSPRENTSTAAMPGDRLGADDGAEKVLGLDESAVAKVKRFSTPAAFAAANSVVDLLKENLGPTALHDGSTAIEVLLEKRRSFLESLFATGDETQTALPCCFSTIDIESVFRHTPSASVASTSRYRHQLAALERLRASLDC